MCQDNSCMYIQVNLRLKKNVTDYIPPLIGEFLMKSIDLIDNVGQACFRLRKMKVNR